MGRRACDHAEQRFFAVYHDFFAGKHTLVRTAAGRRAQKAFGRDFQNRKPDLVHMRV